MKKNDLIKHDGTIFRILAINDSNILAIDCIKRSMPQWYRFENIESIELCTEQELWLQTDTDLFEIDSLDSATKKIIHERFTLVAGVLPFVDDEKMRTFAINTMAAEKDVSKQTIRNYLCLYVQFRYTDWRGERQQKLKRGFPTKKAALAWEREFLMKKQADINMTLESFVELYTQDVKPKLKLNTWLTKESIIQKKILPYLGKRKLSEITPQDIFCWQNEIRKITDKQGKPLSTTYPKSIHNQISAIFNHAVRYYGLQSNPAAKAGSMGEKEAR